jgi:TM2 domain-containing membrane protein YozV
MKPLTHSKLVAYVTWILGFVGMHRFYLGRPISGCIWFFTAGLVGVGWIIDLFLIPEMVADANRRFTPGRNEYTLTWLLLVFLGYLGFHRFYLGK